MWMYIFVSCITLLVLCLNLIPCYNDETNKFKEFSVNFSAPPLFSVSVCVCEAGRWKRSIIDESCQTSHCSKTQEGLDSSLNYHLHSFYFIPTPHPVSLYYTRNRCSHFKRKKRGLIFDGEKRRKSFKLRHGL